VRRSRPALEAVRSLKEVDEASFALGPQEREPDEQEVNFGVVKAARSSRPPRVGGLCGGRAHACLLGALAPPRLPANTIVLLHSVAADDATAPWRMTALAGRSARVSGRAGQIGAKNKRGGIAGRQSSGLAVSVDYRDGKAPR